MEFWYFNFQPFPACSLIWWYPTHLYTHHVCFNDWNFLIWGVLKGRINIVLLKSFKMIQMEATFQRNEANKSAFYLFKCCAAVCPYLSCSVVLCSTLTGRMSLTDCLAGLQPSSSSWGSAWPDGQSWPAATNNYADIAGQCEASTLSSSTPQSTVFIDKDDLIDDLYWYVSQYS